MNINSKKIILSVFLLLVLAIGSIFNKNDIGFTNLQSTQITSNGSYTSKDDVASYIFKYKRLPQNFITKKEAIRLGWAAAKGNLWDVAPGKSIGGDVYHNFEKQLPNLKGRVWREADIEYKGGKRGAKRIVFSNDGMVFYTSDHYKTFKKIDKNDE